MEVKSKVMSMYRTLLSRIKENFNLNLVKVK